MGIQAITEVPQTPEYVKGIINLRGKVIPVVDLRLKFGLVATEYTERTCIIVVQGRRAQDSTLMGVVVDGVVEVLNLAAGDVEDAPTFGDQAPPSYLVGLAKVKGKIKILIDVDTALTTRELHSLDALIAQPA